MINIKSIWTYVNSLLNFKALNRASLVVSLMLLFWHLAMPANLLWLSFSQAIGILFWIAISVVLDYEVFKDEKFNIPNQ